MAFVKFVFGETTPFKIVLALIVLMVAFVLVPDEYGKDMPSGYQLLYFLLLLAIMIGVGFVFSVVESKKDRSEKESPVLIKPHQ